MNDRQFLDDKQHSQSQQDREQEPAQERSRAVQARPLANFALGAAGRLQRFQMYQAERQARYDSVAAHLEAKIQLRPEQQTQPNPDSVKQTAARGLQGASVGFPHQEQIQKSFGRHDISSVSSVVGGQAEKANREIGAHAYASGNTVAFKSSPDLRLAAHEATHIVQQRAGVQLKSGIGQVGDEHEQHADQVADLVVQGKSAEHLLDLKAGPAKPSGSEPGVQFFMPKGTKTGPSDKLNNNQRDKKKDSDWEGRLRPKLQEIVDGKKNSLDKILKDVKLPQQEQSLKTILSDVDLEGGDKKKEPAGPKRQPEKQTDKQNTPKTKSPLGQSDVQKNLDQIKVTTTKYKSVFADTPRLFKLLGAKQGTRKSIYRTVAKDFNRYEKLRMLNSRLEKEKSPRKIATIIRKIRSMVQVPRKKGPDRDKKLASRKTLHSQSRLIASRKKREQFDRKVTQAEIDRLLADTKETLKAKCVEFIKKLRDVLQAKVDKLKAKTRRKIHPGNKDVEELKRLQRMISEGEKNPEKFKIAAFNDIVKEVERTEYTITVPSTDGKTARKFNFTDFKSGTSVDHKKGVMRGGRNDTDRILAKVGELKGKKYFKLSQEERIKRLTAYIRSFKTKDGKLRFTEFEVKAIVVILRGEGSFTAINSYDVARISWGVFQFAGGFRQLEKLMLKIKSDKPEKFQHLFQKYGIDVKKTHVMRRGRRIKTPALIITTPEGKLVGIKSLAYIQEHKRLIAVFMNAGFDKDIQEMQLRMATDKNVHGIKKDSLKDGKRLRIPMTDLIKSQKGLVVYADKRTNGAVMSLFKPVYQKYKKSFLKEYKKTKPVKSRGDWKAFYAALKLHLLQNQSQLELDFIKYAAGEKTSKDKPTKNGKNKRKTRPRWRAEHKIKKFEELTGLKVPGPKVNAPQKDGD